MVSPRKLRPAGATLPFAQLGAVDSAVRPARLFHLIGLTGAACAAPFNYRSRLVYRFVILEHDFPTLHWDLMLETGAALRTWRLDAPPKPGASVAAEPLPDHRLVYLEYEGAISGGRGNVRRWDAGLYSNLVEHRGNVSFSLDGQLVRGHCRVETRGEGPWRLTFVPG